MSGMPAAGNAARPSGIGAPMFILRREPKTPPRPSPRGRLGFPAQNEHGRADPERPGGIAGRWHARHFMTQTMQIITNLMKVPEKVCYNTFIHPEADAGKGGLVKTDKNAIVLYRQPAGTSPEKASFAKCRAAASGRTAHKRNSVLFRFVKVLKSCFLPKKIWVKWRNCSPNA